MKKQKKHKNSIPVVEAFFSLLFILLAMYLIYIMMFKAKDYKARAEDQISKQVVLEAKRGKILDRNGNILADSAKSYRIDADLIMMRKKILDKGTKDQVSTLSKEEDLKVMEKVDSFATELAPWLKLEKNEVKDMLLRKNDDGSYTATSVLGKKFEISTLEEFTKFKKDNGYNWITIGEDSKRYYPNNDFLGPVLGIVDGENRGIIGAEAQFDEYLQGVNGLKITERDQINQDIMLQDPVINKPVDGNNVVLTIDENIQKLAEKVASDAKKETGAKGVIIIVSDPKNGDILAMVNAPGFNPNDPYKKVEGKDVQEVWVNRAISEPFEPGSTFKIVTMAAALNEKKANLTDEFFCKGYIMIGNDRINCNKLEGHGHETLTDLMKNSCNPGFVMLGQRIGATKFIEYTKKFGMGQKSGIDLPAEASGILFDPEKSIELDLGTASIGQTNTVTSIQSIDNLNTIINKGVKIKPHILSKVVKSGKDGKEEIVKKYESSEGERVVSEETAKQVFDMLVETARDGGSVGARVEGIEVLGKTGTAEKIDKETGKYKNYIASFLGAAPANDPKFSVYVAVDEPQIEKYYGGQIAAPKAKILFEEILKYYSSSNRN